MSYIPNNEMILSEVKVELERFTEKLEAALNRSPKEINEMPNREFAACKRAALDLKEELTKLTQSSKYKWDPNYKK